ncbi:MAG: hypothetical protein U0324_35990 [Polyangiales bacterium]
MTRTRWTSVVACSLWLLAGEASPCGGGPYEGPVDVAVANPDLPLTSFAAGRVGVVLRAWGMRRGALVVAYRSFTRAPLDADEQRGFLAYAVNAYRSIDPRIIDPAAPARDPATAPGEPFLPSVEPYATARAEAGAGPWAGVAANGWSQNGEWTTNCLGDAFRAAGDALRARVARHGAGSPAVARWVEGQDAVFTNCGEAPGQTPAALPDDAPADERRDRAWHIAAAHFYAGRFDLAERAFRAIAADRASPWRGMARYLVVRTITRAAQRGRATPDVVLLGRAAAEARSLRDDPAAGDVGEMARRYEGWIDSLRAGDGRAHDLGVALARPGLGARFGESLGDYTALLVRAREPFARQPGDRDRLTAWIAAVEGALPRDASVALFAQTRESAWAVAALMSDGPAADRSLDAALAHAGAATRDDPAWASLRYHRLRVLAARGGLRYDEVAAARAQLTEADGPSARNLFRDLAVDAAPDLDRLLAAAHGTPAAWSMEDGTARPLAPNESVADDLTPYGAAALSSRVPLATLARAAASGALPVALRAKVAEAALLRAALLDDVAVVQAIGAIAARLPAEVSARLQPVIRAPTRDRRRYEALLRLGLDGGSPLLATSVMPVGDWAPPDAWLVHCGSPLPAVTPARFLTAAERAQWASERARAAGFGGVEALLPREAARLAALLPREPRMPALLAAAVQGTRNHGCPARAPISAASRAAFQALHRLFPRSAEARATPYWY